MLGSIHLVDGGVRSTLKALRRTPSPVDTPGLRNARTMIAAPLSGRPPAPQLGRLGLVASWDDEASLDAFLDTHPLAETLAGGWSVRLDPLRAVHVADGPWPGLPNDLPTGKVDGTGPVVVLTIGHLRLPRLVPFLRASAKAERDVADSPGVLWATGLANLGQRIVSTLSIWDSPEHTRTYATSTSGHSAAMRAQAQRSFHHYGSFIRWRPYAATGSLEGRNPLPAEVTQQLVAVL
jgi:hypothetical protein